VSALLHALRGPTFVALAVGFLFCQGLLLPGQALGAPARTLRIVTSFLPVFCFAANVAGSCAEVENLLPGGVGPHDYQFSPRDLRKLKQADLIFINGLQLEDWLTKPLQEKVLQKTPTIVEAAAGLDHGLIYPEIQGMRWQARMANPHIWLDPRLAAHAVTNVLRALEKIDPGHAPQYQENAKNYLVRLAALDAEISTLLLPFKARPVVTYHNAFPYFFRRYQLDLAGVIEELPDVQATPKRLKAVSAIIRQKSIKVLFAEPQFSDKLVKQLAQDLRIEVAELDTLESGLLIPAAYEDAMRKNAKTLERYLKLK